MVAGETSGDVHAGNLVAALKSLVPDLDVWAVGGQNLARAGAKVAFPSSAIASMGLVEVVGRLGSLLKAKNLVVDRFRRNRPDLFVPVDFGGLNLKLAAEAKKLGIPVLYFIPPKAWAWGSGRVAKVRERVDGVLTILPFENDFWTAHGVEARYVGSPILDHLKARAYSREPGVIALLPGSRVGEIERIWPPMAKAARLLAARGGLRFLVAAAEGLPEGLPDPDPICGLDFEVLRGNSQEAMERASLALVASGTATLECALLGTPMVAVYNVSPVTLFVARLAVKAKYIALPNLIAGREIVPELIQADGALIAETAGKLLDDPIGYANMIENLNSVRLALGDAGASLRAAAQIAGFLDGGRLS